MPRRWDELEHPRHPRGSDKGGEFREKGGGGWANMLSDQISKVIFRDEESGTTVIGASTVADWKPGRWTEITRLDWEQEQVEKIADMLASFGISVEERPDLLENALNELEAPEVIYANGPHRITQFDISAWRASKWPSQEILAQVDELIGAFPLIEPLSLALRGRLTISQTGDGASLMGSGTVQLSEKVLDDTPSTPGHFMAQRWTNDYWRYALVHEWGHLIDVEGKMLANRKVTGPKTNQTWEERLRLWKALGPDDPAFAGQPRLDMSDYGRQNDNEGVAEAFAEWFLSKGRTRNNAAKEYARHYGWDKTWPPK